MSVSIDRDRLVDWASKSISIPSFTGSEEQLARFVQATFEELGLQVQCSRSRRGAQMCSARSREPATGRR